MTSPNQTAIVEDHVDDALASGARALTGGKRVDGPGDYFEPTVLVDVDHSMKVMREETFGPVVGVMKVRDSEEALRLANDTRYGLSGSVFGEKERAERSRAGSSAARSTSTTCWSTTSRWTCRWAAGSSRGSATATASTGIKKYCRPESIVVITRFGGKREPTWYPYTKARRGLVGRIAQAFNARDLKRRLGLRALSSLPFIDHQERSRGPARRRRSNRPRSPDRGAVLTPGSMEVTGFNQCQIVTS